MKGPPTIAQVCHLADRTSITLTPDAGTWPGRVMCGSDWFLSTGDLDTVTCLDCLTVVKILGPAWELACRMLEACS